MYSSPEVPGQLSLSPRGRRLKKNRARFAFAIRADQGDDTPLDELRGARRAVTDHAASRWFDRCHFFTRPVDKLRPALFRQPRGRGLTVVRRETESCATL
jgi:hypothetical protein